MPSAEHPMPQQLRVQLGVLDSESVAALLDCEPTTVQTRAVVGDLPGVKIGRSWIFPVAALLQRLNELVQRFVLLGA